RLRSSGLKIHLAGDSSRFLSKFGGTYFTRWPTQTNQKKIPFVLTCRLSLDRNRPTQIQNRARPCESSLALASRQTRHSQSVRWRTSCLFVFQQIRRPFQNLPLKF